MRDLPVGTYVEIVRTRLVSQVCIVTCSDPLILRPANPIERFRCWWLTRKVRAGEVAAASEAVEAIERAKEKQT